jgi:hypothetical protein
MRLPPPDFVVVGAPKCGTTAIYATLQQHPELFLSQIKEPHFFSYDLPRRREVETIEDYDRLFARAGNAQLRGETSAHYLGSTEATTAILQRRPDAKFIALVRNPLDMFVSWHNECCKALDEDEQVPERAWMLQEERAQGRRIPKLCKEPAFLQYKKVCSLGAQIQSLFRLVPERQRLVTVFDDLQQHPRTAYERIVDFLGVQDNGTEGFLRENIFARSKSALIARVIRFAHLNAGVKKLRIRLKPMLNQHGIQPIGWLLRHNLKRAVKPTLSAEFRKELEAAFAPDVRLLERLLGRDLGELWYVGDGPGNAAAGAWSSSLAPCDASSAEMYSVQARLK